mmetsp:Transcript_7019/g.21663  ORF Transcript_7019/g.21663 Transcript_7019/m.21663 type:complete len:268 (+) Transcript_7019:43-846(+)
MRILVTAQVLGAEADVDWRRVVREAAQRCGESGGQLCARLKGLTRCTGTALKVLREFYESVPPELDAVVLLRDDDDRRQTYDLEFFGEEGEQTHARFDDEEDDQSRDFVAVGGTFDHLHAGHRLLLAATALATKRRVFVGIAGDELLRAKKFASALQPFDARKESVLAYFRLSRPDLPVDVSALLDPAQPPKAATVEAITGLVVSEETLPGAEKLRTLRRDRGLSEPLHFIVVGLIGGGDDKRDDKLSSTDIRRRLQSQSSLPLTSS